jgi:hypothetical protein
MENYVPLKHWVRKVVVSDWIATRSRTFDLLPEYLRVVIGHWNDILWGSVPTFPFVIWWFLGSPPAWLVTIIFVWVLIVAGYYAWRSEHLLLVPKLRLQFEQRNPFVLITPAVEATSGGNPLPKLLHAPPALLRCYARLLPKCMSTHVVGCRGYLAAVHKEVAGRWAATEFNEALRLQWSNRPTADSLELQREVDQFLDLFYIDDQQKYIVPCVDVLPLRASRVFRDAENNDVFRFDVIVTADNCPTECISLRVQRGEHWDRPSIEVLVNRVAK